jgi:hypothetical protein
MVLPSKLFGFLEGFLCGVQVSLGLQRARQDGVADGENIHAAPQPAQPDCLPGAARGGRQIVPFVVHRAQARIGPGGQRRRPMAGKRQVQRLLVRLSSLVGLAEERLQARDRADGRNRQVDVAGGARHRPGLRKGFGRGGRVIPQVRCRAQRKRAQAADGQVVLRQRFQGLASVLDRLRGLTPI